MARLHALIVLGTRPELIKLAPVIAECRCRNDAIRLTVCFTGQHRELVQPTAQYFGIVADVDLAVMVQDQSLASMTARLLTGLDSAARVSVPVIVPRTRTTHCEARMQIVVPPGSLCIPLAAAAK